MSAAIELAVSAVDDGARLDVVLASHPEVGSRAAAQRMIDAGVVTVNDELRPKRHRVAVGDRVVAVGAPPRTEPADEAAVAVPYDVVYEDPHLLVVDKPAGVVVHPGAGHPSGTLAQALSGRGARGGDPWRPGLVHRLDRDTSGLLVVAKAEAVHRALAEQIRAREVRREYLALVEGRPDARTGTIDARLGRDRHDRTAVSTRTDRPREARTHFRIEAALPRTTLLRVSLETGRTHQIRVHLSAIGHPVCGDRRYGGAACGSRLGLGRQFLHSARLMFRHPVEGETVACESKLPADLRRAFDAASREPVSDGPDGD